MKGKFASLSKYQNLFGNPPEVIGFENPNAELNKFWPISVFNSPDQITLSNRLGCSIVINASGQWELTAPATIPTKSLEMLVSVIEKFIA